MALVCHRVALLRLRDAFNIAGNFSAETAPSTAATSEAQRGRGRRRQRAAPPRVAAQPQRACPALPESVPQLGQSVGPEP
eukprot:99350-Lingulodinium_polyedra.AAC.1